MRRNRKSRCSLQVSAPAERIGTGLMSSIVIAVKDTWEIPPAEAFQFAYTQYLEWLLEPIEAMEAEREQKRAEFRDELQKIADLAPDLLARALTRNGLYSRYFLKGDQDENE